MQNNPWRISWHASPSDNCNRHLGRFHFIFRESREMKFRKEADNWQGREILWSCKPPSKLTRKRNPFCDVWTMHEYDVCAPQNPILLFRDGCSQAVTTTKFYWTQWGTTGHYLHTKCTWSHAESIPEIKSHWENVFHPCWDVFSGSKRYASKKVKAASNWKTNSTH